MLDFSTLAEAESIATELAELCRTVKVGYELVYAEGPSGRHDLRRDGLRRLLDAKLHDIPNTVEKGAKSIGRLGAKYMTVHTLGRRGHGARRSRRARGWRGCGRRRFAVCPRRHRAHLGTHRATRARSSDGWRSDATAAAADSFAPELKCPDAARMAPGLITYVPGIRLADADVNDQAPSDNAGRVRCRRGDHSRCWSDRDCRS